ncbi:MAG: PKD domain-containing protein, partial [Chloroflexota bacterium]
MRNLKRGLFLLPFLTLLIAVLALSSAGSAAADSLGSKRFQESTVELVVSVTPLNVAPGQQATVTIALKNVSPGPIAPEVTILLPASVSTRMNELPSGTIYNAQSGTLSWQPIMAGDGSELRLTLPIIAQVASNQAPEQTVTVLVQSGGAELKQDAKFWIGLAPTASIKLNPPQVAVGQLIQFVGEVSGPVPVAQLWSLGDGRIVEAENPSVFYPYPGAYEVVFQASTPLGVISQRTVVNVVPQAIARFAMSDNTPAVGVPVQFSNESGGQQPLSYLWDFGDGGISTETQPAHTYQAPGTYDVRLYVTGANGQSESIQTVKVGSTPVADFIIGEVVDAGSVIQGQAFADDSATSITWDMGDGRVHEGSAIQHVYWAAGDYPVIVTVANEFGETRMVRSV